ncbi:allophanate hydrolase subunit 1 [Amycolatopsis sp. cg5]|uniref:5-oxoprolinase subunit B family protein n=1 Tax=Amycolatopsis sp. cg5 TaxID=3238802 RepID=UPI0035234F34
MRILRYGARAALVDFDRIEEVLGLQAAIDGEPPAGLVETVPAARTILLRYDPDRTSFERLCDTVRQYSFTEADRSGGHEVAVPVTYDGEDLAHVAEETGFSVREVIARHTGGVYTVAFCGFAPGFGYLTGLDPALRLPRRRTPRTRVPAGSVAIADEYTAIYPNASPGGWQLLGHTTLSVWDVDRDPPQLLAPGTKVRFHEV